MMAFFKFNAWAIIKQHTFICLISFLFAISGIKAQNDSITEFKEFIVSKGRFFGNLTFSLDQRKAENEFQLVREVINQDKLNYRIIGGVGYAIKDNFTLGLSLAYGREREDITFLDQEGTEITAKSIEQGFSVAPQMRNYIPLGTGRLQIFVQTELNFTFGESLSRNFLMNDISKVESDFFDVKLGVSPGVVLFFDRNWAFETRVDIAGLSYRRETSTANNDFNNRTKIVTTGADLRLNLLALNLGVARYF